MWAVIGGQDVDRLPSASTCYNTLKVRFGIGVSVHIKTGYGSQICIVHSQFES